MGYYSTMGGCLRVWEDKRVVFEEAIEVFRREHSGKKMSRFFEEMTISDDRWIEYDESTGKWYGDDEFAKFIAPFVEDGRLSFIGDDNERWEYRFDGEGNVFFSEFIRVEDKEKMKPSIYLKGDQCVENPGQ